MRSTIRTWVVTLGVGVLLGWLEGVMPAAGGGCPVQDQSRSAGAAAPPAQRDSAKSNVLSLEDRADILMARKAYADAVDYYYRALKESKFQNELLWNKVGIAHQQQLNYRGARKAYNQAIHRRKDFAEPWNNLGTTYFMENRFRKSVKYYDRALKLNPQSAPFHLNLGTSYYHLKKFKEAVEEYRLALGIDPNVLTERSPLGTVMQTKSADAQYYFYLAKVFASLGRADEAVRNLRRAFEDGFKDDKKVHEDPDFQKISQHPAFVELMKNRPVAIKD